MGVFNKLVNILFDETEEEIPVITKEEKKAKPQREEKPKDKDEVIITKIENKAKEEDVLFDEMPKFVEEKVEPEKSNTFSFPLIDDEEDEEVKVEKRTRRRERSRETRREANDYLSSIDYKSKRDLDALKSEDDGKKPFTLSPIISPVYGILNENYKKEDIITRDSSMSRQNATIDLDSVRKKAYGSLEDEIEVSLNKKEKESLPEDEEMTIDDLRDDGISINDLLVDEEPLSEEVFDIEAEDANEEIDIEDEIDEVEEVKPAKKASKEEEAIGEDDLFDLIDSIYAGKDEE